MEYADKRVRVIASTRTRRSQDEEEHGRRSGSDGIESTDEHDDGQSDDGASLEESLYEEAESESDSDGVSSTSSSPSSPHVSCIRDAQLSPDETCIFTSDYNRTFSVYPTNPPDGHLTPYATFTAPSPIRAFVAYPHFDFNDSSTTLVLTSIKDQYISLHNALWDLSNPSPVPSHGANPTPSSPVNIAHKLASYKLVNHMTEEVLAPLSLAFTSSGTHFVAGTHSQIAVFDLEHTSAPTHKILTVPSRSTKSGARGYKGSISTLAVSSTGLLAAGTWSRHVGIYDKEGLGGEVTHFSLQSMVPGSHTRNDGDVKTGDGVSQLQWSPCGTYLYVAERSSDIVALYDCRKFSIALGVCAGRRALTKQRLGIDVWAPRTQNPYSNSNSGGSQELWAGGTDGKIRVWRDAHLREGRLQADEVISVGDAPVVSTRVHSSGQAVLAASGIHSFESEGTEGRRRGGHGWFPEFREYGALDVLGLTVP